MALGVVSLDGDGFAFENIVSSGAAQPLTKATFSPASQTEADRAVITVEGGDIRYRYDGTAPTASLGCRANATTQNQITIIVSGSRNIENFQFITTSGGQAATLNVMYERS